MNDFIPRKLWDNGFRGFVSVIPPGAKLAPSSTIQLAQVGKVPGVRYDSGLWGGYDWRNYQETAESIEVWEQWGANVGLRADKYPAVDIDVTDPGLAQIVRGIALSALGGAPVRTGRAPKQLLVYRTDEPFGRMRLWLKRSAEEVHLIEVLGVGQQYVIHGTHPTGVRYQWSTDLTTLAPSDLVTIDREKVERFFEAVEAHLGSLGIFCEREGSGAFTEHGAVDQDGLRAPSLDALREVMAALPNRNELFPSRTDYLRVGYAIRAACGDYIEEGLELFLEWASRWEGNDRFPDGNDPDTVIADWRRMRGPYSVGFTYLAEQAKLFGYAAAADEFEPLEEARLPERTEAPLYSDQWLADCVVEACRGRLRYVPETGKNIVWDGARWEIDTELLAEDVVKRELREIADRVLRQGATAAERRRNEQLADRICSAGKVTAVTSLVRSDRAIAVSVASLDADQWVLNTPGGLVDLKTGKLLPPNPDALATRSTSVRPQFGGACPLWHRFLDEATAGDKELQRYLQRLAGYCLTGSTREQQFTFVWGPGGNGKSVFLNVLVGILGDYATTASMDTFTASKGDKHTTDLAMLVGARLVSASETEEGKRWDEARVKTLSGGERVTARFMRQDNFTFMPTFKLIFIGNHKPGISNLDDAMRRRIHLVPFVVKPSQVDRDLGEKLQREWPAILAWMVEGCLAWQREGLNPPPAVRAASEEYFEEEDAIGLWIEEMCETDPRATATLQALFTAWSEWANLRGEYVGNARRLSSALAARRFEKWIEPETRRRGFRGLRVREDARLSDLL